MLANITTAVHFGRIDRDIHLPSAARLELVDFIAQELPRWRDHPARPPKQAETALTEHLCDHLNSATYYSTIWSHVQFRTETGDETNVGRRIDLTVKPRGAVLIIEGRRHSQFAALFPIECKRLPTPKEPNRDEREYVFTESGATGGIHRFKFGYHGATHRFGAMIGYMQEQTFSRWLGQVNGWIRELSGRTDSLWSESDVLQLLHDDPVAGLCMLDSHHRRAEGLDELELRHLWIRMSTAT